VQINVNLHAFATVAPTLASTRKRWNSRVSADNRPCPYRRWTNAGGKWL